MAVTFVAPVTVTVQTLPLTDVQPVKPANTEPAAAVAVSWIVAPDATDALHAPPGTPQLIGGWVLLATVP